MIWHEVHAALHRADSALRLRVFGAVSDTVTVSGRAAVTEAVEFLADDETHFAMDDDCAVLDRGGVNDLEPSLPLLRSSR